MPRQRNGLWIALSFTLVLFVGRMVFSVPAPYIQAQEAPEPLLLGPPGDAAPFGSATPQPQPTPLQSGETSPGEQGTGKNGTETDSEKSGILSQREQLRQLFERRLELMNDADISNEIHALKHNVAELEALKKLKEIQKSLTELIEVYPQTGAANAAQSMLQQATVRYHDPNEPFSPDFRPLDPSENGFGPTPIPSPYTPSAIPQPDGFQSRPATTPGSGKRSPKPAPTLLDAPPFNPSNKPPGKPTPLEPVSTFPSDNVFKNEGF